MGGWFTPRHSPGGQAAVMARPAALDDEVAAWLRRRRDAYAEPFTAAGEQIHHFLTGLLNEYRFHLAAGVPLDQELPEPDEDLDVYDPDPETVEVSTHAEPSRIVLVPPAVDPDTIEISRSTIRVGAPLPPSTALPIR